jgi:hypothetical protein
MDSPQLLSISELVDLTLKVVSSDIDMFLKETNSSFRYLRFGVILGVISDKTGSYPNTADIISFEYIAEFKALLITRMRANKINNIINIDS